MNEPAAYYRDFRCEGCNKPAKHFDTEGIPLCADCYAILDELRDELDQEMRLDKEEP